jgi:hypothetical protein
MEQEKPPAIDATHDGAPGWREKYRRFLKDKVGWEQAE